MATPTPYIAPMEREVCPQQRCCRCHPCGGGVCVPPKPRAPPPRAAAGPGVSVPGSLGPPGSPPAPRPAPGWVFPSRGGRREAGRGRGRFGEAPSPGSPAAPAGQCPPRTPARGESAPPGEAGRGLRISVPGAGVVLRDPLQRHVPYHPPPKKPFCAIAPRSRGSPPKANGGGRAWGCLPLPERWPGGAPERGGAGSGSFSPAVSRSRNFPRPGPVRGSRGLRRGLRRGGTPRPGRAAHPGPCLYVEKKGNLSAYTKNQGC